MGAAKLLLLRVNSPDSQALSLPGQKVIKQLSAEKLLHKKFSPGFGEGNSAVKCSLQIIF